MGIIRSWTEENEPWLVSDAKDGDLQAFDVLVLRYRPAVTLMARQIVRERELAEDVVQDSFVTAFKSLGQLDDYERFAAWLGVIVRRKAMRLAAGEKHVRLPLDEVLLSYVPALVDNIVLAEDLRAVQESFAGLAEDVRTVIVLYYHRGWRVRQIAEFLGLPQTTVKWRLHTGRVQLRTLLSDREECDE